MTFSKWAIERRATSQYVIVSTLARVKRSLHTSPYFFGRAYSGFGEQTPRTSPHHHRHRFVVVWLNLLAQARCIDSSPITTGMTIQSSVKIELRQRRRCGECESDVIYTLPATDRSPPMLTRAAVNFRHGVACRAASGTPRQALYRHCSYRLR